MHDEPSMTEYASSMFIAAAACGIGILIGFNLSPGHGAGHARSSTVCEHTPAILPWKLPPEIAKAYSLVDVIERSKTTSPKEHS